MSFLDRVGNEINVGDFLVYVTAGDRHPVLEFGYVEKFHETKDWSGSVSGTKIKFQKSSPQGRRKMIHVVDVPAHWRLDTPQNILDYGNIPYNKRDSIMSRDEYVAGYGKYFVQTTYKETDKFETTMLEIRETIDASKPQRNNRMMLMEPVV